jgi:hypothetical protein
MAQGSTSSFLVASRAVTIFALECSLPAAVAQTSDQLVESPTRPTIGLALSGGAGIRFRLNQENRVNFRVDYAIGENDQDGFYVGVMEAF